LILDNVHDASIVGLAADGHPQAESLLRFIDTTDALVVAPRVLSPAAVFLRVEGSRSASITVDGGDLSKAARPLDFGGGAARRAVKQRA